MHQDDIIITRTNSDNDLLQIISLQQKNLPHHISKQEAIEQGFVTVEHDLETLQMMHEVSPSVIAKQDDQVIGYALVMTKEFGKSIPVLIPMFELFDKINYQKKKLSAYQYFVMGQVCIDKNYRGLGLFDKLYAKLKEELSHQFELMITEVATRNQRSIKAHKRVGLKTIHIYNDDRGEEWQIMIWNWNQ